MKIGSDIHDPERINQSHFGHCVLSRSHSSCWMSAAGMESPAGSSALSPDAWLPLLWLREWQQREEKVWARLLAITSDWRAGRLNYCILRLMAAVQQ